jgi:hypothetical protein
LLYGADLANCFATGNVQPSFLKHYNAKQLAIMNNETFTPEVVKTVKELQAPGFVPLVKERLEKIVDFFIDDEETSLSADTKLEYIKLLRTVENSLEPFSVEGGES